MIDLRRSRLFKRLVVAVYWVAVAVCLLGALGAFISPATPNVRWSAGFAFALAGGVFVWRLWLYRRALGLTAGFPDPLRLSLVWIPLAFLALGGCMVALLGMTWIAIGLWLAAGGAPEGMIPLATSAMGLVALPLGGLMCWPLARLVRRRRMTSQETNERDENVEPLEPPQSPA
ncbi:MAG: hypothetical protein EON88_31005 [Brevundimonas sp.]|nr:MAG: hypothetical protein EON88_31005 [Brevundimonas sp.]